MAEPKGGPVKPPTLDLKASRSGPSKKQPVPSKQPARTAPPKGPATGSASGKKSTGFETAQGIKPPQSQTSAAKPNAAKSAGQPPKVPPRSASKPASKSLSAKLPLVAGLGALGGALLSLLIMVPLLLSGFLRPGDQQQLAPQLAALTERVGLNEEQVTQSLVGFNVMNEQLSGIRIDIENQNNLNQIQVDRLGQQQSSLKSALDSLLINQTTLSDQNSNLAIQQISLASAVSEIVSTPDFDTAQVQESLTILSTRMDAIAAGASTQDAEKLSSDLTRIQSTLSDLQTEINTLKTSLTITDGHLVETQNTLASNITLTDSILAQNADALAKNTSDLEQIQIGLTENQSAQSLMPVIAISNSAPIALMEFQLAVQTQQPFLIELENLSTQLPELEIPELLTAIATQGLAPPADIAIRFSKALPQMLAARPANPNANWTERVSNTLQSILAVRPLEQTDGDPISSLVSQIEASVAHLDFVIAAELIELLPDEMVFALGNVSTEIVAAGAAEILLNAARITLLSLPPPNLPSPTASPEPSEVAQ